MATSGPRGQAKRTGQEGGPEDRPRGRAKRVGQEGGLRGWAKRAKAGRLVEYGQGPPLRGGAVDGHRVPSDRPPRFVLRGEYLYLI